MPVWPYDLRSVELKDASENVVTYAVEMLGGRMNTTYRCSFFILRMRLFSSIRSTTFRFYFPLGAWAGVRCWGSNAVTKPK